MSKIKLLTRAQRNLLRLHSLRWYRETNTIHAEDHPHREENRLDGSSGDWCVWQLCPSRVKGKQCSKLCGSCLGSGRHRLFHASAEMPMANLITLCREYAGLESWP